jgi:hypothetical protein
VKSLAHQSDAELGGPWSVLVRQQRDHTTVDRLLEDVLAASAPDHSAALRSAARAVFPHAFADEVVLWPELCRVLPEGRELTMRVELQHREVNDLWLHLEGGEPTRQERERIVERVVTVVRDVIRDQDEVLLPRLQESVDVARLRRLGMAWEVVRRTAPTRPRSLGTRGPAGSALAALPLSVLDRSRDRLDAVTVPRPGWRVPLAGAQHG